VTELTEAPPRTQMSPRDRRRVLIGLAALISLLFVGGMVAYLLDFRHHSVCPGGKHWVSKTDYGYGGVTYQCPNGLTVTQSVVP
jgi:hypothetical protein